MIPALAKDQNGNVLPISPGVVALAEDYDATISSSTSFNVATGASLNEVVKISTIEVTAIDKPIFLKWGGTGQLPSPSQFYWLWCTIG